MGKVKTMEKCKGYMRIRLIDRNYLPNMQKKCVDKGNIRANQV